MTITLVPPTRTWLRLPRRMPAFDCSLHQMPTRSVDSKMRPGYSGPLPFSSSSSSSSSIYRLLETRREGETTLGFCSFLHLQSVKLLRQYREVMKTIMESQGNKADNNRRTLEQAWQTIANEFYEPQDNFKSSSWAQALVTAAESLQVRRR